MSKGFTLRAWGSCVGILPQVDKPRGVGSPCAAVLKSKASPLRREEDPPKEKPTCLTLSSACGICV